MKYPTALALLVVLGCPPEDPPDAGMDAGFDVNVDAASLLGAQVTIDSGELVGESHDDLVIFRGIPYAAPPLGDQRWRRPQAFGAFEGVRDATSFGERCPQWDGDTLVGAEDCLFLNVWAPRTPGPRPVMVFIHGGSFTNGAGSIDLYESSRMARDGDVVVVTINYRLGPLGFLNADALAAEGEGAVGNYGLHDQIAALQWVQRNIAAFGGDAGNVMVFGESAGSISICALLGSELADGLFHRAALQSGGGCNLFPTPTSTAAAGISMTDRGNNVLTNVGCDDSAEGLACARSIGMEAILAAPTEDDGLPPSTLAGLIFHPGIDGHLLTDDPIERIASATGPAIPVIIGTNEDEAALFTLDIDVNASNYRSQVAMVVGEEHADAVVALYPIADFVFAKVAFNTMVTDLLISCSVERFAQRRSESGHPTRLYEFRYSLRGLLGLAGSAHGIELPFLFGEYFAYDANAEERALGDSMRSAWTSFARTGTPDLGWGAYQSANPSFAVFDVPVTSQDTWRGARCDTLRTLELTP